MPCRATVLLLLAATLAAPLAGCTLISQRTFNPNAGKAPVVAAKPGPAPDVPLVTIDFDKPNVDYQPALDQAVQDAVARKPDVQFDVVTVVPASGTTEQQVAAATSITPDARGVARAINARGVDDDRIHLAARSEIGVRTRQVQVFVR